VADVLAGHRDGVLAVLIRHGRGLGVPGVFLGHDVRALGQGVVPEHALATVSRHAAHDRGERANRAVLALVVGDVVADRVEKVVVLLLVRVLALGVGLPGGAVAHLETVTADVSVALGAVGVLRDALPRVLLVAA